MAPHAELAKIGYEIEKLFGRQRSFGSSNNNNNHSSCSSPSSATQQNLCQYKFYPAYGSKVVHMHVEDIKCNEAASRFIADSNRTELHTRKGLVGQ